MKTRTIVATLQKATNGNAVGTFVLSEESPDRMGDIIEVEGWDFSNFKKNPIALWQHDHDKPIGSWRNIRVKGKQLLGDLYLGSTRLADMAQQLIEDGILKAVSVGFVPVEHEPLDEEKPYGGWRIKASELLEVSLVSVPAHPQALLLSKSLGLSPEERRMIFSSKSKKEEASEGTVSGTIERARKALETSNKLLDGT